MPSLTSNPGPRLGIRLSDRAPHTRASHTCTLVAIIRPHTFTHPQYILTSPAPCIHSLGPTRSTTHTANQLPPFHPHRRDLGPPLSRPFSRSTLMSPSAQIPLVVVQDATKPATNTTIAVTCALLLLSCYLPLLLLDLVLLVTGV